MLADDPQDTKHVLLAAAGERYTTCWESFLQAVDAMDPVSLPKPIMAWP
jgi:hypothetical protein